MHSPGTNEGELRGQPANRGSPGKNGTLKRSVCVCAWYGLFVLKVPLKPNQPINLLFWGTDSTIVSGVIKSFTEVRKHIWLFNTLN